VYSCEPVFSLAMLASQTALYSGVSGGAWPRPPGFDGSYWPPPMRTHWPFQSGYLLSICALLKVGGRQSANASTIDPTAVRPVMPVLPTVFVCARIKRKSLV
jgi:hypothetical protein